MEPNEYHFKYFMKLIEEGWDRIIWHTKIMEIYIIQATGSFNYTRANFLAEQLYVSNGFQHGDANENFIILLLKLCHLLQALTLTKASEPRPWMVDQMTCF